MSVCHHCISCFPEQAWVVPVCTAAYAPFILILSSLILCVKYGRRVRLRCLPISFHQGSYSFTRFFLWNFNPARLIHELYFQFCIFFIVTIISATSLLLNSFSITLTSLSILCPSIHLSLERPVFLYLSIYLLVCLLMCSVYVYVCLNDDTSVCLCLYLVV